MEPVIDLIADHGVYGVLVGVLIVTGYVFFRLWRDLVDDRNYWRDKALRLLNVGETLATKKAVLLIRPEEDEETDAAFEIGDGDA